MKKSRELRRQFYEALQNLIDSIPKDDHIIIIGDLNATISDDSLPGVKQGFHEPKRNDNDELLVEFCVQNSRRINNTFFNHD